MAIYSSLQTPRFESYLVITIFEKRNLMFFFNRMKDENKQIDRESESERRRDRKLTNGLK
jgi:hypothetical protein